MIKKCFIIEFELWTKIAQIIVGQESLNFYTYKCPNKGLISKSIIEGKYVVSWEEIANWSDQRTLGETCRIWGHQYWSET